MSVPGVGSDVSRRVFLAAGLALLLAGCAGAPWPLNRQQVVTRAPQPPQVLSANSETKGLRPCPQPLIAQAQWLGRNLARVRLGFNKLQVVSTLGDPASAETFGLTNGAVVEVLMYHTPETVCRVNARTAGVEGLLPLVFQDDRLLGYGPMYYRQFIKPILKDAVPAAAEGVMGTPAGAPQPRVQMKPAEALRPAPARTGRVMQEDLPQQDAYGTGRQATPPASNYRDTPVTVGGNAYSDGMNMYPASYNGPALGRGEPLR